MTRTRTFFACLLGSFLIATQIAQAASSLCPAGGAQACCYPHQIPEPQCAMGCATTPQPASAVTPTPSTVRVFSAPAAGVAPDMAPLPVLTHVSSNQLTRLAQHDPPCRRYLMACNLRL